MGRTKRLEINFSQELMKKFGQVVIKRKKEWYLPSSIWYVIDWRNQKLIRLQKWFFDCLEEIKTDKDFVKKVNDFMTIKDLDDRAVAILKYVSSNLVYKRDVDVWKINEKWQTPLETWKMKSADCEDGSLLLAAFLYFAKIPEDCWDIVCGEVKNGVGKTGHCWVDYTSMWNAKVYTLDWCYYYSNKLVKEGRVGFCDDDNYLCVWFGFNSSSNWKSVSNPNKKIGR